MIYFGVVFRWFQSEFLWLLGPLIEILFIAAVIYVLLKFVQGTRGAGILRGVVLFMIVAFAFAYVGSRFFQLERIGWVLENMLTLLAVALIIIFQPEIRRGLVRLGKNPVVNIFLESRTAVVDELVEACTTMARRNVGALIAIQRVDGLRNYIETGTRLDAEVSARLISTIFQKETPLHDGAIIVQGTRIAAAECLFRLSENPDITKDLGTRHRAGVGLTEESDAVAVMVSEQTGGISISVGGEITLGLSAEDLHAVLTTLCTEHID